MKLFAMLMLRCALVILLSSLLQNGTFAQNKKEYLKLYWQLEKWEGSCRPFVVAFSDWDKKITLDDPNDIHQINQAFLQILSLFIHSFDGMLGKVKEFPLGGMEERLKRRLQKPLEIAKLNCNKLLDEVEHGLEENKNYLESLLSKIRSIANGIEKEFNTFIYEIELELIIKIEWTPRLLINLHIKFGKLLKSTEKNVSYCNASSFKNGQMWADQNANPPQNQREFVEDFEELILEAKLGILENELSEKIAAFAQQQPQDGDGFMEFSEYFIDEWGKIKQKIGQLKRINAEKKKVYRKRLNDLAESAMEKTAPLKGIITKKLDELIAKCHNDGMDAMKQIISDIGIFDGAAYKLLVSFGQKLEEAVKQDKEMLKTAYQVKDKITPTMK